MVGNLSVPTAARAIFWRISRSIPKSLTQTLPYRRKTLRSFIKRNAIFILQAWFSALCFRRLRAAYMALFRSKYHRPELGFGVLWANPLPPSRCFNFYELRLLKRLKTSLEQGLPISHEKDYTKKLQLKRISNLIYAILGITLLLPPLSDIYSAFRPGRNTGEGARFGFSSPYVPMEEITKSASDTEISLYSEPTLFAPCFSKRSRWAIPTQWIPCF